MQMRQKQINVCNRVYLFLYVFVILMFSSPIVYQVINPYFSYVYFLAILMFLLCSNKLRLRRRDVLFLIPVGFASLSLAVNHSGIGNLLQIIFILSLIIIFQNKSIDYTFLNYISRISDFFIIVLSLKSLFVYDLNDLFSFIMKGEINPNTTAEVLIFLYLFACLERRGHIRCRMFLRTAITVMALVFCQSRVGILSFFIVLVCVFLFRNNICNSKKIMTGMLTGIIVVGVTLPILYVLLFSFADLQSVTFFGKYLFTGRQWIWMNFFEYLGHNPQAWIFGSGTLTSFYVVDGNGYFNMHNAYLALFATFGLAATVTYIWLIISVILRAYKGRKISQEKFYTAMVMIVSLVNGIAETTLSYLPMLVFPGLALVILVGKEKIS